MRVASTPMERAAAFSALLIAIYASPLLLTTSRDAWEFINHWDDDENFVKNAVIQSPLTAESVRTMWTMGRINVYEPLGWMLKAAVCQFVGLNAWWVRVVTLALHVAACAVLARASAMLLELLDMFSTMTTGIDAQAKSKRPSYQRRTACFLSAAMFVVHPVHVQVVAWPSGQPYALVALFANLAIYAYLRPIHEATAALSRSNSRAESDGARSRREDQRDRLRRSVRDQVLDVVARQADTWSRTFVVTGLYACALLSKSAAIFTPAAFVLIDMFLLLKASAATSTPVPEASGAVPINPASSQAPAPSRLRILVSYTARKLPLVVVFAAFALVTISFNRHGAHKDTDVLVLTFYERVVKALGAPVDVAKLLLWPAKLRPHYLQLELQYSDVWRADNLLPIVALVLVTWMALYQCHPSFNASQHVLALAYFGLTLLPVCGLIQHGMVSGTADRYAYMGSITLVPYGGAILSTWLFRDSTSSIGDEEGGDIGGRDHPESTTPVQTEAVSHRVALTADSTTSGTGPSGTHRWALVVLVSCTLLRISTQLMATWRTEETLYNYELQMDPFDWRELDTLATMLNGRGDCMRDWEMCTKLWERSFVNTPTSSIKAKLYRLRTLIILGGASVVPEVCTAYKELAVERPDQPLVLNNLGVCRLHEKKNEEARGMFVLALANAQADSHRATIEKNIAAFDEWEQRRTAGTGGTEGTKSIQNEGFAAEVMY